MSTEISEPLSPFQLEDGTKDQPSPCIINDEEAQIEKTCERNAHLSPQPQQEQQTSLGEVWNPDKSTFSVAFLAVSPFLFFLCQEMAFMVIPYFTLLEMIVPLAFLLRDYNGCVRWVLGLFTIGLLSSMKTSVLIASSSAIYIKVFLIAFTAFWECSNVSIIFGGRELQEKYGITSYTRASFVASCPVQIKFIQEQDHQDFYNAKKKWLDRSFHLSLYFLTFMLIRSTIHLVADLIEDWAIIEAEAIVISVSMGVHIWNIPPHIYQLFVDFYSNPDTGVRIQIIYPFGSIYFSTSSREFWRKWSRPASSLIRHMFYYPLGGSRKPWLSIPIMFLLNASGHYDISMALVGDRAVVGWNTVYGVLGLVATMEVLGDRCLIPTSGSMNIDNNGEHAPDIPRWWYGIRFLMATAAFRFAAYTLVHKCLHMSFSQLF